MPFGAEDDMRQYAYEIVINTLEKGGHSDECFHRVIKENPNLDTRQKSFIKRLSFGTVERAIELDTYLDTVSHIPVRKMEASVRTVLRMALYEICYMEQVPGPVACHEAVELIRAVGNERQTGFVNGVLREFLRLENKPEAGRLWQSLSLPRELMEHFISRYGKKTAKKIASAFLEKSGGVTIHIDTNKVSPEKYREYLDREHICWQEGVYWEDAVILPDIPDIVSLPGYGEGLFFVQDESSMLPVKCAGIKKGNNVIDVCSAPGGKCLHALVELAGTGTVLSRDVSEKKAATIRENIERLGYSNAVCEVWDATRADESRKEQADVILADVPCSGIGIIGRKPEIKYHALEQTEQLVSLQREICRQSVKMLKPGGIFIYSTCTIHPKENEENVIWLEEQCGLQRESLNPYLPESLTNRMTEKGMLQMLPGVQKSDGFFVARMRKKEM